MKFTTKAIIFESCSIIILCIILFIFHDSGKDQFCTVINLEDEKILYMLPITNTHIENEVFELSVPEDFIGKVAYTIEENANSKSYIVKFYHIASVSTYFNFSEPLEYDGLLGILAWFDQPLSLEAINEDGTINWEEDYYVGTFTIVQKNEDGTGVYRYSQPCDVQYSNEFYDEYMYYNNILLDLVRNKKLSMTCELP